MKGLRFARCQQIEIIARPLIGRRDDHDGAALFLKRIADGRNPGNNVYVSRPSKHGICSKSPSASKDYDV